MKRLWLALILLLAVFQANALSLALDSIREWGKFPNFCVDVYRWGDRFFNTYDSAYVVGTGHKFNLKLRTESWVDYYNFDLPQRHAHAYALRSEHIHRLLAHISCRVCRL